MISLEKAIKYGERICAELAPWCEVPPMIAGSARRGCPQCGDIDLVILPRDRAAIKARCKVHGRVVLDGSLNFIVMLPGEVQLDIFFAHGTVADMFDPQPTNVGSLLLCRTGSVAHNVFLVEHAKRLGLAWEPYRGVTRKGRVIASASEAAIYQALQLPYLEPAEREIADTIHAALARWARSTACKAIAAPTSGGVGAEPAAYPFASQRP
jgi:DNA polymerase (family 10)